MSEKRTLSNIKIWNSLTQETSYVYDTYDSVYDKLADEFGVRPETGFWVANKSEEWVKTKACGQYFIVEEDLNIENNETTFSNTRRNERVILFCDVKDATHFKLCWIGSDPTSD